MMDVRKLLMGGLFLGLLSSAEAQTVSPKQGFSAHTHFRSFYKSRNIGEVPKLLVDLDRSADGDWTAHPPIIGFIAGLLIENPRRSDLLPRDASTELQSDLAIAYSLPGQSERGLRIARQIGLDEKRQAFIRSTPFIKALTIQNPTELDYLWGAAFATGNPLYVRPIVKRFAQLIDTPGKANDVLAMCVFVQTGKGDMRSLKERYDRAVFLDLVLASAMLAGLSRNAAEHEFIRHVIAQDLPKGTHAHRLFTAFAGRNS